MTDIVAPAKPASPLKLVREFFGMNMAQMKAEWTTMAQADKDQISGGLADGTLTY